MYYNKFQYIGFTILKYAKIILYKYIYDDLESLISNQDKIHYSDTDSDTISDTDSLFIEFILKDLFSIYYNIIIV